MTVGRFWTLGSKKDRRNSSALIVATGWMPICAWGIPWRVGGLACLRSRNEVGLLEFNFISYFQARSASRCNACSNTL
jgi:hypothetical protein